MLGLCKCVPPKPVTGGWLRQCLGSVTARRERMYVAYGAALRSDTLSGGRVRRCGIAKEVSHGSGAKVEDAHAAGVRMSRRSHARRLAFSRDAK